MLWRQTEVAHQHDQREAQLGDGHVAVVYDQHGNWNILARHIARLWQIQLHFEGRRLAGTTAEGAIVLAVGGQLEDGVSIILGISI